MRRHVLAFLGGRPAARRGPVATRVVAVDRAFDAWVDRHRSPAADRLFYSLSSAGDHGLLWLAIGAARAAVVPRHRRTFFRYALALGAESALTNGVVKSFFRRVRPELGGEADTGPLPYGLRRPITSAFPSGHAATGFTAATLLAEDDPLGPAYFGLAVLVAASRVYVRLHHTSDIVAGAAWGRVFGVAVRRHVR